MANGGDKNWETSPYIELGRKAYLSADTNFDIGSAGAGFSLMRDNQGGIGDVLSDAELAGNIGAITRPTQLAMP